MNKTKRRKALLLGLLCAAALTVCAAAYWVQQLKTEVSLSVTYPAQVTVLPQSSTADGAAPQTAAPLPSAAP